jgi:hypothetical protein
VTVRLFDSRIRVGVGFLSFASVSVRCIFRWDNDDADKNEWEYKKWVSK